MTFTLSPQQQAVLSWVQNETGSLELIARAGCGKTFTLIRAVETIAQHKLGEVAIMAYNKAIAEELKAKLAQLGIDWKSAQAGTVHSFGFAALRRIYPNVKIDGKKLFTIIDKLSDPNAHSCIFRDAGTTVAKLVSLGKQAAIGHLSPVEDTVAWFKLWDHFGLEDDTTEEFSADQFIQAAIKVFGISLRECKEIIDFDDMILAPLVLKARFWQKDWVLVDEAQDTNPARRALALAMLKPKTGRMIFVGDDRQAIYGFTGASSDSMDQLRDATQAATLPLNVTYRCPKAVVADAQRIVPDISAHDSAPEGVVRSIKAEELEKQELLKTDVILCRNTAPLITTAYRLLAKGTACKVEGREIGTGLIKLARRWKLVSLEKLTRKLEEFEERETAKLMSKGKEERVAGLVDQLDCLRIMITRCQSLQKHTVNDLVAEIESMFGDTKEGEKPRVLTLSTIHKSKGREWPRVFLFGRRRYMPSPYAKKDWQQVQEANLEYVAVTRAQQELIDVEVGT